MSRVALVVWSGGYGGAETWTLALCRSLNRQGYTAGIVVIGSPRPLFDPTSETGIRIESMGLSRGSDVIARCGSFAALVRSVGADVAILPSSGFVSAALRMGGYRGRIIAVEHGDLLQTCRLTWSRRLLRRLDQLHSLWAPNAQVVPSDFMLQRLARYPHSRETHRIHLGLNMESWIGAQSMANGASTSDLQIVIGFAGRLIRGKGVETLLEAAGNLDQEQPWGIEIAGDGPCRAELETMAVGLGIASRVNFRGWIADVPHFWKGCHLAVVPSNEWTESFGMVAIEAMASGLPVIASRNGGLTEIVVDGETGTLFSPGDPHQLSQTISLYLRDPGLRARQGAAAMERVRTHFDIERCAAEFGGVIDSK